MTFLIVTGLSGAGKSGAVHALEDIGFYCVDNVPPELIVTFYGLFEKAGTGFQKIAIVTDIRGGRMFKRFSETLDSLKKEGCEFKLLYIDAEDDILIRRFKETRRRHPLADTEQSLEDAVHAERRIVSKIRERADYVIDTTHLSPAQLKERISLLFLDNSSSALMVQCVSFGFKYGIPAEADLVFDVRCLPNPYYVEELKHQTGLDGPVYDYVMKWDQTKGFVKRMFDLIDYTLPLYCDEGKSQLVVAIGCTGGHHRSVALAQLLYSRLQENRQRASVHHRDIRKS